jgi:hypothetical protein
MPISGMRIEVSYRLVRALATKPSQRPKIRTRARSSRHCKKGAIVVARVSRPALSRAR